MAERMASSNNANGEAQPEITETKRLESALQQAIVNLTTWVHELEQRIHEIDLLSDMDDQLQDCRTCEEAYAVIAHFMQQLFARESGVLYLFDLSSNLAQKVVVWGNPPLVDWVFIPKNCWALRPDPLHLVGQAAPALSCFDVSHPLPTTCLCVPIMAEGETLGLLQVRSDRGDPIRCDPGQEYLSESKQRLAVAVAELIALALEKLKLQDAVQY